MKQVKPLYVENDVCGSFSLAPKLEDLIYERMKYYFLVNVLEDIGVAIKLGRAS